MSFMRPEMTEMQSWLELDTSQGVLYVPAEFVIDAALEESEGLSPEDWEVVKDFSPVTSRDEVYKAEWVDGWGVRLSSPGYIDSTEWEVFEDEEGAKARFAELLEEEEEGG